MNCSPSGSSVYRILQARILEWVAILFSGGSSQPRDWTRVSCLAGRFFIVEPPGKPKYALQMSEDINTDLLPELNCQWKVLTDVRHRERFRWILSFITLLCSIVVFLPSACIIAITQQVSLFLYYEQKHLRKEILKRITKTENWSSTFNITEEWKQKGQQDKSG